MRRLALLVQLMCFSSCSHFPAMEVNPPAIVEHVAATLGVPSVQVLEYPAAHTALYRDHETVRELLGVGPNTDAHTRKLAVRLANAAASVVETRADIINIVVEELVRLGHELPVFRTLDDIAVLAPTEN